MDLNQLYFRHQVSLMRADAAFTVEQRRPHEMAARRVAEAIDNVRTRLNAASFKVVSRHDAKKDII